MNNLWWSSFQVVQTILFQAESWDNFKKSSCQNQLGRLKIIQHLWSLSDHLPRFFTFLSVKNMTARGGVCFSYMEKFATNHLVKILLVKFFREYHQSVKQLRSKQLWPKLFANVINRKDTIKS